MVTLRSSNRISLSAIVLLALSAQIQLVSMYYTFVCHPETRYGGIVATPPKTQDWLDLVQLAVQWACSLLQYVDLSNPRGHPDSYRWSDLLSSSPLIPDRQAAHPSSQRLRRLQPTADQCPEDPPSPSSWSTPLSRLGSRLWQVSPLDN